MAGTRAIGASAQQLGSVELAAASLWDPPQPVPEEQAVQKLHAGLLGPFDEKALYPGAAAGPLAAGQFCCQMLGSYCSWTAASLCCRWPAHPSVLEELIISHSEAELARTIPKKTEGDNPACNCDFLPGRSSVFSCRAPFTSVQTVVSAPSACVLRCCV